MPVVTPFLWFDNQAEHAEAFYRRAFFGPDAAEFPDANEGQIGHQSMVELPGVTLRLFNGGPHHPFNHAISLFIEVADQAELDRLWEALCEGGEPGRCGWLTDPYGVSWQVVPTILGALLGDPDPARAKGAFDAMMTMQKLDIAGLLAGAAGGATSP